MKRTPHGYTQRAEKFLFDHIESGAFLEPGLGKTGISLSLIKKLKQEDPNFRGALVIAPLRPCYLVWPKEMRKWEEFKSLSYTILHGDEKDEKFTRKRDVYIMNPEGLPWLMGRLAGVRKTNWPFSILIVDESGKFRRTKSQRYKNLKKLAPKFDRRHLLNGTPAPKSLMDLFGQFMIMDGGKTFGTKIGAFQRKYFYKSGYQGFTWKPHTGADKKIFKAIAPSVIQMKAEDYLELPELIINPVYIELPPKVRLHYNEMEKKLRLDFEEGRATAANAGILSSKCRQIACGGVYLDDEEQTWKNLHDEKTNACLDLVEELQGSPALLTYEFRHDLDRLQKAFGTGVPAIKSRLSMSRTKQLEDRWNNGELELLFGQHTTIALGLNLQDAGNTMIVHTLPWSYETWYQLVRRLYRQGQKAKKVIVHTIIAKKTVEERVLESLQNHETTHVSLFSALKDYWGI